MAEHETSLMQIRVLRYDDQTGFFGVLPYNRIVGRFQTNIPHVK